MKPVYTPLSKLNDHSKDFKVKVKVIYKGDPRQTPPKRRYQKLKLKDDEGNMMDGTIFGDDIEVLDEAILQNGEYELSNVLVKSTPEPYKARSGDFQMSINGAVRIKPLDLSGCSIGPQFRPLSKIPRDQDDTDELIDIVGVVLYVSELRVVKREESEDKARDIVIADDSTSRPSKITAWNDAAEQKASFFNTWADGLTVVGFTNVRPLTKKGISLVIRSAKAFVEHPLGIIADGVREWVSENKELLEDWRAKALLLHSEKTNQTPVPVKEVLNRKASTIWQDERFWIQVSMYNLEEKELICYKGCDKCGRSCSDRLGTRFVCGSCHSQEAVAVTRCLLNILVSDKTGSLRVTAYTAEVELMVGMNADAITALRQSGTTETIKEKIDVLKKKEMLLQIAPAGALFVNNMLKWVVRGVAVPPEE